MKKATATFGLVATVLIAGGLFINKAHAQNIYVSNYTAYSETLCLHAQTGIDLSCTSVGTGNGGFAVDYVQPLNIKASDTDPEITVSGVSLYVQRFTREGTPWEHTGYLLDFTDYAAYVANGYSVSQSRATSTPITISTTGEQYFEFTTPLSITDSSLVSLYNYYFVVETTVESGTNNFPEFNFRTHTYPNHTYADDINFKWKYGGNEYNDYDDYPNLGYDFMFTVYRNDPIVTILSPAVNETISNLTYTIDGECSQDVNIELRNASTTAASSHASYFSRTCTDNLYSMITGYHPPEVWGQWWITVTTTDAQADTTFFYFPASTVSSTTPEEYIQLVDLDWSCDMPLVGDPCAALAYMVNATLNGINAVAQTVYNKTIGTRPYSYVTEIKDIISDARDDSESSSTTPPLISVSVGTTTDPYHIDTSLFSADTLTGILNQETWDGLRGIFNLVLYIVFGMYLYNRFIKMA